jgi:hypothetical protein
VSTGNERDMLRRAMQLADGIEPRGDGLQRIQAKLRPPRPLAVAWAEGSWTYLRTRVPAAFEAFVEVLRSVASLAWERFGPRRSTSGGRAARTLGWLRPAAALGVTVFIVAAGTYIAIDTQQGISPSASNAVRSTGGGGGAGGGSQGNGGGTNAQGQSTLGSGSSTGPKASPTCRTAKPAGAKPSASQPGQIQSTSPSASPSDSSGGVSPSPTTTDSSTPTPGATDTGQASLSTAGTDVPAVGSSSPAVAALTSQSVQARHLVASSSLPLCGKRPVKRNSPGPTPNAHPAVFSFGQLDDGR